MKEDQVNEDGGVYEYGDFVAECYQKLRQERDTEGLDLSLAEVKLRLFLSLLDKPQSREGTAKAA